MKKQDRKTNDEVKTDDLLAEYLMQSAKSGKHSYSEQLHNDSGSGCCLCDLCNCGCQTCACCEWFSTGGCCW